MRQLDLFGSLFETPSQEDTPEEKAAVSKKKEENQLISRTSVATAYSKNTLRSERVLATTSAKDASLVSGENPITTEDLQIQSTLDCPSIVTLFDAFPIADNPEIFVRKTVESIIESPEQPTDVNADEEKHGVQYLSETTNDEEEVGLDNDSEFVLIQEKAAGKSIEAVSLNAIEITSKPVSAKQKRQKPPELERTGSVIFDDGKISVKIKNKSPFPAPIVKKKKEKVKKLPQKRGRKSFKEIDAEVDLIEIPDDEILYQKQYYAISEVAKWFRVNTSLLRFWENEFDVLKPRKNRKGDRLFRPEDVKNLQLIYQLLRQRKYTIEGAKEYIKTNKKKADIQLQLTNTLQKFKSFLLDMKANLQ